MTRLSGFRNNLNVVLLTDYDGYILDYNPTARIFFGDIEPAGTHFLTYVEDPINDPFRSQGLEVQPSVTHGLQMRDHEDPVLMRIYCEPSLQCYIIILESMPMAEEVLIAQEQYKWSERLQIMLFGISHELKTPVAVARGYTEVLTRGDTEETASKIMGSLDRIAEILNTMTEPFSELVSDEDYIDLGHSIEMYVRTMPYTEPTKRYVGQFEANIDFAQGRQIRMIKSRFYQILTNLFENAVRATDHLGTSGEITLRTRPCYKPYHGSCVVMDFSDNGVGMSSETQQNVFTPYFTTRAKGTGTGLGGYFIYQFCIDAGGTIEVDSELGEGTTFSLHLPYT